MNEKQYTVVGVTKSGHCITLYFGADRDVAEEEFQMHKSDLDPDFTQVFFFKEVKRTKEYEQQSKLVKVK